MKTTRNLGSRPLFVFLMGLAALLVAPVADSASLPETINKIKPSVVGVGTYQATRTPPAELRGTGFAVGDGRYVLTNAHVLPDAVDGLAREYVAVFLGGESRAEVIPAKAVAIDRDSDLAALEMTGHVIPALRLGDSKTVQEGQPVAFTGFPIGAVLGLHPVTHTGIVSAITPIVTPVTSAKALTATLIRRMKKPYQVFQLDATAYPGNSGSPVFDPASGDVIGVINKVFVQGSKETLLEKPSGITYAIPIEFANKLLDEKGLLDRSR